MSKTKSVELLFLSTPSGWRATGSHVFLSTLLSYFYPRPPGGGRLWFAALALIRDDFYPRPPGGGRPRFMLCRTTTRTISIHALRVEGDPL